MSSNLHLPGRSIMQSICFESCPTRLKQIKLTTINDVCRTFMVSRSNRLPFAFHELYDCHTLNTL